MCRICDCNPPDPISFRGFEKKASEALHNINDKMMLLDQARIVDKLRFDSGDEWGEPSIFHTVRRLIFANPDPDEGFLLFTLGCWLDMQAKYVVVWDKYLRQAKNWIDDEGPVPRRKFTPTTKHLLLTRNSVKKNGNISRWFAQKINEIAEKHGKAKGNIYRLAGEICNDLYSKPEVVNSLRNGILPNLFSGGDHKRFWMFIMFLRRDNSIVRCLFTRALSKFEDGQKAAHYWYNSEYFDPIECELPVDTWVLTNWNKIFNKLKVTNFQTEYTSQVAAKAREIALKNNISPSTFDAILFYS